MFLVFWMMRFLSWIDITACVLLVGLTMLSRIFLGVHWVSDTVVGALIGATNGFFFGNDYICLWLSDLFFDNSIHPLFPAVVMTIIVNILGIAQCVLYFWYGNIEPDLQVFYDTVINRECSRGRLSLRLLHLGFFLRACCRRGTVS